MSNAFFEKHPLMKHLLYMLAVSVLIVFLCFMFIKLVARQGKEYELPDFRGMALTELERENPLSLKRMDSRFTGLCIQWTLSTP